MAASEVVISMLISKLREVMPERDDGHRQRRELQYRLSPFIEELEEMLYDTSVSLEAEPDDGHRQQQCKNVMICAREAEDIADTILVESSMPPKSLKGLFIHMVGDPIGYGESQAKARKLIEKLVELSWHYTKMQGGLLRAERGPMVHRESRGSRRAEYQMKQPTTTTTMAFNSDKLPIIGRELEAEHLANLLKGSSPLQMISVIGEEGVGKTALVRSMYDRPDTERLFPCRAWISYSDGMSLQRILLELYKQSPAKALKDLDSLNVDELGLSLIKLLAEYRYLIVLDGLKDFGLDINRLLCHLPYNDKGNWVIVTSREVLLSLPWLHPWAPPFMLYPLNYDNSRKLLQRTCGIDDQGVIHEILMKCRGSTMKLLLCGGLVAASVAGSEPVAKWLDLLEQNWPVREVMRLSFRKLPHWVKPCLLYLCLFPRGFEIPTRRVFQLWYAEGLACRNSPNTAKVCLQELLNRNVVQLVTRRVANGSPKTCCLQGNWHDYLSEMAARFGLLHIDGENKHVSRQPSPTTASPWLGRCWGDSTSLPPLDTKKAWRLRSYVSFKTSKSGKQSREVKQLLKPLQGVQDRALLRVLDLEGVYKPKLPDQFGDLLPNLRYLGLRWTILDSLPKSVANLSKLETLDLKHTEVSKLPGLILTLKYLRHLYLNEVSFDNDIPSGNFGSNMETLWGLTVGKGSQMLKALGKFKRLRKLGLTCHSADVWEVTENISTLTMLELLRLRSRDLLGQPGNLELGSHMKGLLSLMKLYLLGRLDGFGSSLGCLPENLRVLTLSMSELQYDPMSSLGQLQHLVKLSLLGRSYVGQTITFPRSSFPSLQELRLWKLEQLREIRMEAGSMKSLEELEIRGCKQARMIGGLKHAPKLKYVKLTEVAKQFASQVESWSSEPNRILTSRELLSELSIPEAGFPGELEEEVLDMIKRDREKIPGFSEPSGGRRNPREGRKPEEDEDAMGEHPRLQQRSQGGPEEPMLPPVFA